MTEVYLEYIYNAFNIDNNEAFKLNYFYWLKTHPKRLNFKLHKQTLYILLFIVAMNTSITLNYVFVMTYQLMILKG